MGNEVTVSEALIVTAVSIVVVFLVLILISFMIGFLKTMSVGKKKDIPTPLISKEIIDTSTTEIVVVENNEELVAVVAAAVAASLGLNIPDINIQSIRRIPQSSAPWAEMSKQEQLLGKL